MRARAQAEWRSVRLAVKHLIVTDQMSEDDAQLRARMFHEEMRIMAAIAPHPHVMRLSGTSPSPDSPLDLAIVTDFMVNTDLWRFMQVNSSAMSPQRIMYMASAVAHGLRHLHANCVVHRDIASRNILIDRALSPRIGDFSLAVYGNDAAVLQDVPHSKWLAPEVRSSPAAAPSRARGALARSPHSLNNSACASNCTRSSPTCGALASLCSKW